MASRKYYAYYIRGRQLALIEYDANTGDGLNYVGIDKAVGTSLDDIGPGGGLLWGSPKETISNGLEIEYTYSPSNSIIDETDTIDLPEYLAKGLVYYVKAKVAEDQGEIEQKEYFMREFRRILEKHESSKMWGPRMMIPGSHGIR